jgi:hypothetical protein
MGSRHPAGTRCLGGTSSRSLAPSWAAGWVDRSIFGGDGGPDEEPSRVITARLGEAFSESRAAPWSGFTVGHLLARREAARAGMFGCPSTAPFFVLARWTGHALDCCGGFTEAGGRNREGSWYLWELCRGGTDCTVLSQLHALGRAGADGVERARATVVPIGHFAVCVRPSVLWCRYVW